MLEIGGILLVPIIVALVELAKRLGLAHEYAAWLNAGLSVVGFALVQIVGFRPGVQPWVIIILQALIVFLAAAGLYREGIEKRQE